MNKIDLVMAAGSGVKNFQEKTVVVIDVFRASSTILTALANGSPEIIPVAEPEEAFKLAEQLKTDQLLLGGEREGLKIDDFDLGNSPLEYTKEVVAGKKIILCTSNGTKALREASEANKVIVGSFLNAGKVINHLKHQSGDIVFFCAGRNGGLALEDLLCAGMMVDNLFSASKNGVIYELSDTARVGMITYRHLAANSMAALARTEHGQYLSSLGFTEDLRYCGQVNLLPYLACFKEDRVVLE